MCAIQLETHYVLLRVYHFWEPNSLVAPRGQNMVIYSVIYLFHSALLILYSPLIQHDSYNRWISICRWYVSVWWQFWILFWSQMCLIQGNLPLQAYCCCCCWLSWSVLVVIVCELVCMRMCLIGSRCWEHRRCCSRRQERRWRQDWEWKRPRAQTEPYVLQTPTIYALEDTSHKKSGQTTISY